MEPFSKIEIPGYTGCPIFISLFFFPIFSHPFFFHPSRPFLIEGVLGSKNLFWQKLLKTPKNLRVDPVGHFGAPWQPLWILQAVRRCRRLASAPFAARLVFLEMLSHLKILWENLQISNLKLVSGISQTKV